MSNRNGRNPITIDWEKVEELAESGASGIQIAAKIGIHAHTLYKKVEEEFEITFSDYIASRKSRGDAELILHQYKKALGKSKKGDTQLLLMLGKERLGQGKSTENEFTNQKEIDKDHDLMRENYELRKHLLNESQPETNSEFQRS